MKTDGVSSAPITLALTRGPFLMARWLRNKVGILPRESGFRPISAGA